MAAADPFAMPRLAPGYLTDREGADMATLRWVGVEGGRAVWG